MFEKEVVIDCRGHIMGRLASIVAKELLCGQKVVCVRCEELNITGNMMRNSVRREAFMRKTMNTNPARGHRHQRSPAKIFERTIRGMVPHKSPRGGEALSRLRCYEGVPEEYAKVKRMVVPDAYRVTRLRPDRAYITLGDLSAKFGWKHADLIKRMEAKRLAEASEYYKNKKTSA